MSFKPWDFAVYTNDTTGELESYYNEIRPLGFTTQSGDSGLVRGDDDPLGAPAQAGSVLQIIGGYTSRITGMISGRREVSFTM